MAATSIRPIGHHEMPRDRDKEDPTARSCNTAWLTWPGKRGNEREHESTRQRLHFGDAHACAFDDANMATLRPQAGPYRLRPSGRVRRTLRAPCDMPQALLAAAPAAAPLGKSPEMGHSASVFPCISRYWRHTLRSISRKAPSSVNSAHRQLTLG